jgi:hypothetical protein
MNNDEDQFAWMAHEMTADLPLSPAKEKELADILEELARELTLAPDQLKDQVEKDNPLQHEDHDAADWWKDEPK